MANEKQQVTRFRFGILQVGAVLLALFLISQYDFLLFHSLAEFIGASISIAVFLLAWNSRAFSKNTFFIFIGSGLASVGILSIVHALAYKGMGVFPAAFFDSNIATQLWLASQFVLAGTFVFAPVIIRKNISVATILLTFATVLFFLLASIFLWKIFPAAFIEGTGQTTFKKISEYIVAALFLLSAYLFWLRRRSMEKRMLYLLFFSLFFFFISTLSFTHYVSVFDFFNMLGHQFRIVAFYSGYLGIVELGLMQPYNFMFRELKDREKSLGKAKSEWERTFDSVPDLVAILDKKHRIVRANKAMAERLGTTPEACVGLKCYRAVHKCDKPIENCPHAQSLLDGKEHVIEVREPNLGGDFIVSTTPLRDEHGEMIGCVHVARDITERKKIEQLLRLSEDKFSRAFSSNPAAIALTTLEDGKFIEVNDTWIELEGYKREEVIGRSARKMNIWPNSQETRRFVRELKKNGVVRGHEQKFRKKSGEIFVAELAAQLLKVDDQDVILSTLVNITERKKLEKKLEDLAKFPLENPSPVMRVSLEGKIIYANPAADNILKIFDIKKGGLIPENWNRRLQFVVKKNYKINFEIDADNQQFLVMIAPVTEADYANVYFTDITVRKKAEMALNYEKEKLKQILDRMEDGVYIISKDYEVEYVNPALEKHFGPNLDNKKCFEYLHDRKSPCPWCMNKQVFAGKSVRWECHFEKVNKTFDIIETLMRTPENRAIKLEILRDITEKNKLEKAKDDFISLAAHQLRTPLATIGLSSELLLRGISGDLHGEQREYLEEIHKATKRMTLLVSNLLNVSRLEMGTFSAPLEPVDVLSIIQTKLKEFAPIMVEKNLELENSLPEKLPSLLFNANSFEIVFDNLLSNAIRYTPSGGRIYVTLGEKNNQMILKITDTGCGIPADLKEKVFEKSFRSEDAQKISSEGAGLGLYMVKSIADLTGTKIWFDSRLGEGTTFFFSIPLSPTK